MFLRFLMAHNPALVDFGVYLLEHFLIEPDTYVLDLDHIANNAMRLRDISARHGLNLYFMAKQLGRNPEAARRVLAAGAVPAGKTGGFTGMVAVDFREASLLHSAGLPVRHLGHLCQVPKGAWDAVLDMKPDAVTLYSKEKAEELSGAAQKRGIVQNVLLRIRDEGDIFYQGHEGGFPLNTLNETLDLMEKFPGLRIAGLTSFPCFLYQEDKGRALPTPNAHTLRKGAALLHERGIQCLQINMPSCNSPATMPLAAELGATHLEPGHSLTGTNPDNLNEREPLTPSLLYVTEVSHHFEGRSFCFGGGHYRRSGLRYALIKTASGYEETEAFAPAPEAIDYHLQLSGLFPPGSPVCMAFRTQIFVTRSRVALVEGLSGSRPSLLGLWDSQGRAISGSRG
jgi:predicted amino acid racemase